MKKFLFLLLCISCTAQVSNQGLTERGLNITGNPHAGPIAVTPVTLPNGTQATTYAPFSLTATGGVPPYSGWTVSSGAAGFAAAGFVLNSGTGIITGSGLACPSTYPCTIPFFVTTHDTVPTTATAQAFSITIIGAGGCGPPAFPCARLDFNCPNGVGTAGCTFTNPSFGPALSHLNTNYTDPYFLTNGLVISDNNFDSGKPTGSSFVVVTSGSSEEDLINIDDSKIWIQHTGQRGYPVDVATPGTTTGVVSTSGTAVTWTGGTNFNFAWSPYGAGGLPIVINGTTYTISAVTSPKALTLTTSAGTQSGVAYSVTVTTMKSARLFNTGIGTGYFITGSGSFSRSNRCYFDIAVGTQIQQLDLCQATPPSATVLNTCAAGGTNPCIIFDYSNTGTFGYTPANCLGTGYTQTGWGAFGGVSAYPPDVFYSGAFSTTAGQGTGSDIAAYVVGQGCSHLNTQSLTVTGDFGSSGAVTPVAGVTPFKIHNTKEFIDGTTPWLVIEEQSGTCTPNPCPTGPLFWKVGTLNVYNSTAAGSGGGHKCEGDHTFFNNFGSPFGNFAGRSVVANSFLTTVTSLIPSSTLCYAGSSPIDACYPPGAPSGKNNFVPVGDDHCGYNDADINDSIPFTDAVTDGGQYYCPPASKAAGLCSGYPSAWYGELRMIQGFPDGSGNFGRVYREGMCFSSMESQIFDAAQCTIAIGSTGKYTIISFDGLCTLGDNSGGTSPLGCYPNWQKSTLYPLNTKIAPFSVNACNFMFNTTTSGTTAATQPTYSKTPCNTTGTPKLSTAGTAITWVSGTTFNTLWTGPIIINGSAFSIASCSSTTSCTLTTSAGTQTSVTWSLTGIGNFVITDGTATLTSLGLATTRTDVAMVQLR